MSTIGRGLWYAWDRLAIYLPVILMGLLAAATYWLARSTPTAPMPVAKAAATHEPDYYMRRFAVKTFDQGGRLKSEVAGAEIRHFPDTETIEIDHPRIRSIGERGQLTTASADRALSNADGSEVQLMGNALVVRGAGVDAAGRPVPSTEFRGEFLHAFMNTERVRSNKPVSLKRGSDSFSADSLEFDNLARTIHLQGRVRTVLTPRVKP